MILQVLNVWSVAQTHSESLENIVPIRNRWQNIQIFFQDFRLLQRLLFRRLFPLCLSKKFPTGPTERTPKPEYLIALATYLGFHW